MKIVKHSPLFLCFALASLAFCVQPSTPVILISVDTLRADHLSCYQPGVAPTPHIDSLTQSGTLFTQINTPYPLTLPAHVALFTSTYPFENGIQDNGIPLSAGTATLASVLKSAGYRTGAFVGSFVLDRRFGLAAGFDTYDGPLDVHNKVTAGPVEHKRPGDQVEHAAKEWLDKNSSAPFFLFLHLYDLHAPYSLPPNPRLRQGETGYQAELAYVDRLLGDFFAFLDHKGLLQKTLIVFTSDHGEGLGDHGESSHGYFTYQSTLRVPLIMRWPAAVAKRVKQNRVDEPASLLDVVPTILDAIGVNRPAEMRGRSLLQPHAEEVYSESLYARKHFGCATLRSVRSANYKYIDAPKPELYDLAADPHEQHNLYDQQRSKAAALREKLVALRGSAPDSIAKPNPESVSALRSLGYLSGPANRADSHIDPKDRIADFERYSHALNESSDALLQDLAEKLPDIADIRMSLGMNRQRRGQYAEAARDFNRVIALAPSAAAAHFELGLCYFKLQHADDAVTQFKTALALEPWYTRADEALAEIYLHNQDFTAAREHLNHLLTIDPNSYTGHFNLGIFAAMDKDWNLAKEHMLAAVHADPDSLEAHKNLGGIYLQMGDQEDARREFETATRLQSKH